MQGQALIGWIDASLATTLATAEISMKCFPHRCLRSFCWFCGAKYYFFNCFITLDSLEWYFQYFYWKKQLKNPSKTTFFVWDIVNEWTSGTWICPPIVAFPNLIIDASVSPTHHPYFLDFALKFPWISFKWDVISFKLPWLTLLLFLLFRNNFNMPFGTRVVE